VTFLKKILLLDHHPAATAPVRRALEETGHYAIREEHDTNRACHAARWYQPDLILCDGMMSRDEAGDVRRRLQSDAACAETPVVFVSANPESNNVVISSGILSGYSFFAQTNGLEEFVSYVAEILRPGGRARPAVDPQARESSATA
jgi:CheY-like chemotaxis protein